MDYSKSIEQMRDRTMELLFDFTDNKKHKQLPKRFR